MLIRKQKYVDLIKYVTLLLDSVKKKDIFVPLELCQNPLALPPHTYICVNKCSIFIILSSLQINWFPYEIFIHISF